MRRLTERAIPDLPCISYAEIPSDLMIEPLSIVKVDSVFADAGAAGPASAEQGALVRDTAPLTSAA